MAIFTHAFDIYLDAAPWLLFGLVLAAAIKVWLPDGMLSRWLGGDGPWPVVKAALIGAPLPLCSCGVLPAAIGLHRAGASRGATVSFLVATPETGPDSITVSYALLGPFMAVARPIAAVVSAIVAGSLAGLARGGRVTPTAEPPKAACCSDGRCGTAAPGVRRNRLREGYRFVFVEVLDDIAGWLVFGFLLAGTVAALVPPAALVEWGGGIWAKLVMVAVGVPLYICATASTPVAAAMIAAGVSPGTALVFLLVGPATNGAGVVIVARELGRAATAGYLAGLIGTALLAGVAVDALAVVWAVDMIAQTTASVGLLPPGVDIAAGLLLAAAAMGSLWRGVGRRMRTA